MAVPSKSPFTSRPRFKRITKETRKGWKNCAKYKGLERQVILESTRKKFVDLEELVGWLIAAKNWRPPGFRGVTEES